MFKNILNATDTSMLPLIALIVFFTFFSFIIWHTMIMKKDEVDRLSEIPLNENQNKIGDL